MESLENSIIENLYLNHQKKLFNYAYHKLKDENLAADTVQDAFERFIKCFSKRKDLSEEALANYLFIILKNRTIDVAIKIKKRNLYCIEMEPDEIEQLRYGPCLEDMATTLLELEDVKHNLKRLSPKQAAFIALKYFGGCTDEEIANALDIKISSLRMLEHRARVSLKSLSKSEKKTCKK